MAPSEILPGLFIGDALDAVAWTPTVGRAQKRALICVLEACPFTPPLPFFYHVHLLGTAPDLQVSRAALDAVSAMLQRFRNEGWSVLVYCGAGIERSPLAVAWYLGEWGISSEYYRSLGLDAIIDLDGAYRFIM